MTGMDSTGKHTAPGGSYWNSQSGKFSYQIGKGDNAISYSVNFELTTGDASTNTIQNTVSVLPNDSKIFKTVDANGNPIERGGVSDGKSFSVQDQYFGSKTIGPHEMGHNLGADHSFGLMDAETGGHTENINRNTISDILYNATGGYENSKLGGGNYKHSANAQVKSFEVIGKQPENFNKGKVKKSN